LIPSRAGDQCENVIYNIFFDGNTIRYSATAGLALIYNDDNEPVGTFGYTAYFKEGIDDLSKRPIMFAYNGGPGSASIWLHRNLKEPLLVRQASVRLMTDDSFRGALS